MPQAVPSTNCPDITDATRAASNIPLVGSLGRIIIHNSHTITAVTNTTSIWNQIPPKITPTAPMATIAALEIRRTVKSSHFVGVGAGAVILGSDRAKPAITLAIRVQNLRKFGSREIWPQRVDKFVFGISGLPKQEI